ncbi:MAG: peptidylprolyl isomerase [Planctomycetota bacterium]|nr:peptidylprolyl isomerase [Planctomycetota bacterium]
MRYLPVTFVCLLLFCGCHQQQRNVVQSHADHPKPGSATTMPTSVPAEALWPAAVMATVNGKPVHMEDLYIPLIEAQGLRIAEILIVNKLVAQEAERVNIIVDNKDVAAENNHALQGVIGEQLAPDQRGVALEKLLRQRGITKRLWTTIMRRNAILRKMVAGKAVVSEAMIETEFARLYGEKVRISHIQLPSLTEAEKIIKMLKEGNDFAYLARRYSTSTTTARQGGTLPQFSRENPAIPRAIRDTAFALKTGQISGIVQVGNEFHVLKLHQRITPPAADFQAVRGKIILALKEHLIERLKIEKLAELRRKTNVEYVNPTLRQEANRPPGP